MSNIQYFKLINGTEIIADVTFEDEQYVELQQPLSVEQVPSEDGRDTIMLMPYAAFSQTSFIEISKSHLITKYTVDPVLESYYKLSVVFTDKHQQFLNQEIEQINQRMKDLIYDSLDDEMFDGRVFKTESKSIN